MLFNLSEMSSIPLRDQLVRQVREAILSGQLAEHEQLPSIRGLAKEVRVGVVTVQRAFEDLEREGFIYARQGKGYFVAPISEANRSQLAEDRVRDSLQRPLMEALAMGLTPRQVQAIVQDLLAGRKQDDN